MFSWYTLLVRSSEDAAVEAELTTREFMAVSLRYEKISRHARTKARITKFYPLFRGYVFVYCSPEQFTDILAISGVVRFLSLTHDKSIPAAVHKTSVPRLLMEERNGAFRAGPRVMEIALGDLIQCEVMNQIISATLTHLEGDTATLSADMAGKRLTFNKDVGELRAA